MSRYLLETASLSSLSNKDNDHCNRHHHSSSQRKNTCLLQNHSPPSNAVTGVEVSTGIGSMDNNIHHSEGRRGKRCQMSTLSIPSRLKKSLCNLITIKHKRQKERQQKQLQQQHHDHQEQHLKATTRSSSDHDEERNHSYSHDDNGCRTIERGDDTPDIIDFDALILHNDDEEEGYLYGQLYSFINGLGLGEHDSDDDGDYGLDITSTYSPDKNCSKGGANLETIASLPTCIFGETRRQQELDEEGDEKERQKKKDAKKAEGNTNKEFGCSIECAICQEDYIPGDELRILPCNHRFHKYCVDPWLLHNNHASCPLCKNGIAS